MKNSLFESIACPPEMNFSVIFFFFMALRTDVLFCFPVFPVRNRIVAKPYSRCMQNFTVFAENYWDLVKKYSVIFKKYRGFVENYSSNFSRKCILFFTKK